jgi:AhpD family alkylhydroperoxidase
MPRISEVEQDQLPSGLGDGQRTKRGDPTWERVAAHCPQQLIQIDALMRSFAAHGTMPRRYIEIAVVTVSRLNECRHCVGRHATRLYETGLPHEIIEHILEADCPGLDEKDRLVRDYARQVSEESSKMRDVIFEKLHAYFDEPQIVELTMRIGLAGFFNRFNNALQIDLDEGHLNAFLAQNGHAASLPDAP